MVSGLIVAFIIFVFICATHVDYMKYLVWYWNGGALRVLNLAGVSSFAHFYGVNGKCLVTEISSVCPGKCVFKTETEKAVIKRDEIHFLHVITTESSLVAHDSSKRNSLARTLYLQIEESGKPEALEPRDLCLGPVSAFLLRTEMAIRLYVRKAFGMPIGAWLLVPKNVPVWKMIFTTMRNDIVVVLGRKASIEAYANIFDFRIIPVTVILK